MNWDAVGAIGEVGGAIAVVRPALLGFSDATEPLGLGRAMDVSMPRETQPAGTWKTREDGES